MNDIFHAGELAVQRQAGVLHMAARVGNSIKPTIPLPAVHFLAERPFAILASIDSQKQVWASILTATPPFMHSIDERTLLVRALPPVTDPLRANIEAGDHVGMLAIDFATRRRMRLNGTAELHDNEFIIHTHQVYANCPKYIQQRTLTIQPTNDAAPHTSTSRQLSAQQIEWITGADTLFIATAHPESDADASHRGGNPGFVHVQGNQLVIPDYSGNLMFNTLGNITCNPNTGLLLLDFAGNRTLQLTGQAKIVWDEAQVTQYVGAERLVVFETKQVIETQNAMPFSWIFQSYSPVNPVS